MHYLNCLGNVILLLKLLFLILLMLIVLPNMNTLALQLIQVFLQLLTNKQDPLTKNQIHPQLVVILPIDFL